MIPEPSSPTTAGDPEKKSLLPSSHTEPAQCTDYSKVRYFMENTASLLHSRLNSTQCREKTTDSLVCVDVGCKCDKMMEVFGLAYALHSLSEQRFGQGFEYSVK